MQLQAGETIQSIHRRHAGTMIPGLLLSALLMLIPSFFLFLLLQLGVFGVILVAVLFGYGLFQAAKTFLIWDAQVLLLTNRRLVHVNQIGLWRRAVSEVPLSQVQAVEHESRGLNDLILRTSNIKILASGAAPLISFAGFSRANLFTTQVIQARDEVATPGIQSGQSF